MTNIEEKNKVMERLYISIEQSHIRATNKTNLLSKEEILETFENIFKKWLEDKKSSNQP